VRLFLDRARQAVRGFALTESTAPHVADICSRLDGLPLAIELAAARIRVLSPADLLVRLELGVPLPRSVERDRPERHQTLTRIHRALDKLCRSRKLSLRVRCTVEISDIAALALEIATVLQCRHLVLKRAAT